MIKAQYCCLECGVSFTKISELNNHQLSHQSPVVEPTKKKREVDGTTKDTSNIEADGTASDPITRKTDGATSDQTVDNKPKKRKKIDE